jgi:hypothetical protein
MVALLSQSAANIYPGHQTAMKENLNLMKKKRCAV